MRGVSFLNINQIEKIFCDRKAGMIGKYKKSSVMILISEYNGIEHVIFEVRSRNLRYQPGDVCLPGGRVENGETPILAAIRESKEELNLKDSDINVIGEMDFFISPYGSIIYAFVATLNAVNINPNKEEVDHVFAVPLSYFMDNEPACYEISIEPVIPKDFPFELIRGGKNYKFSKGKMQQYFYEYEDYVIWGVTARIIKEFIDILKKYKEN